MFGEASLFRILDDRQYFLRRFIRFHLKVRTYLVAAGIDRALEDGTPQEIVEIHLHLGVREGHFHHMRVPRKLGEESEPDSHGDVA